MLFYWAHHWWCEVLDTVQWQYIVRVFPAPTAKLRRSLCTAGLKPTQYSGYSFLRGGATYAFCCGAPVELISLKADWSSDAVHLYIAQPLERPISVAHLIAQNIVSLSP